MDEPEFGLRHRGGCHPLDVDRGLVSAAPGQVTDPDTLSGLVGVRQATARYLDVNLALADG